MAAYNTFVVVDCKKRTPILVTSSARKARGNLSVGYRVEVWSDNKKATVRHDKKNRYKTYRKWGV